MDKEKAFDKGLKVSFKDLVWIIMLVASILGTYYTLSGRQDLLEREVVELTNELHETNIQLLKHDIDYLKQEVKSLKEDNKNLNTLYEIKRKKSKYE